MIVARHGTTPYAFNQTVWTKYGKIFADTANAIGNARFVPAGIVAVTRAQERGYALVSIG